MIHAGLSLACPRKRYTSDLQKQLALVMEIFNGLGEAPPTGRRTAREKSPGDDLFGMSRR